MGPAIVDVVEQARLSDAREAHIPWKKWGPYLSERQWGTVREDYSDNGDAWNYFTHDHARSRAYKWGEDGIGGLCDDQQRLCFALALWNEQDAILKERLFGLTNSEGNHGEDVKEYYFYVDSTPTHSYMKYLYKYPQREYPYLDLVQTNRKRSRDEMEYELLDTGIFDDDRYFDVFVEYAKAAPEDILIRITVHNRGPEAAPLRVLPTLWFRNTWSWGEDERKPSVQDAGAGVIRAAHHDLGEYWLHCEGAPQTLFTENESNAQRLWGQPNASPYVKDGFHAYVISEQSDAVNPERTGTKAAAHYTCNVPGGGNAIIRLRLASSRLDDAFGGFEQIFDSRLADANEFYERITPKSLTEDQRRVHRQALAGMLWGKQYYYFDLELWLREHHSHPLLDYARHDVRNMEWFHMLNADVISMPDKWEYPWYAAWDLAFHTIALAQVDFDFAKEQLLLMLRSLYVHPSGQIPAYEWNFSDVNPPVHAAATLWLYKYEKELGRADPRFLERSFQGLMLNFNWWVNRKDPSGRNVFAGGFLGLDNIGVFDRSAELPTGGSLEQADGTAWMAFYCQTMLEMAINLTDYDPLYEEVAFKFVQHFMWIAYAMDRRGAHEDEMWDEQDGFFYDLLRLPDGKTTRLKIRSLVGLLPLCASTVFEAHSLERMPKLVELIAQFRKRYPELLAQIAPTDTGFIGYNQRRLLSILNKRKLERVLGYMLDEKEFLGPHGIRSLSLYHLDHPYVIQVGGQEYKVQYLPAESNTGMFGGNSNWRGPVWMPVNLLIVRALVNLYTFFGDDFKVECPTGSGQHMTLFEVAQEIVRRLTSTFLRNADGKRPVYGGTEKFQSDPHWRDLILFYEYFHGDNGAGLGASHQTGWTGLVAPLLDLFGRVDAQSVLETDRGRVMSRLIREQVSGEEIGEK
ncbi:MGH1-like glycoside hydrolase domain-containing protein [Paraburkholderia caledonica]|uniref:MGH1-like glycoside hydrolase domain-containing protein n=1 Tax=Paraburkholderia caledonica TaxID=134536 RepID=UPI000DEF95F8|nr:glucosidase [Paraburkholderia caledonica]AXF18131.1 glucosidase [Paraburkholderia caledonica]